MSVVNGLHTPLAKHTRFNLPHTNQERLFGMCARKPPNLQIASGLACNLPCRRVLTVGTDMSNW